MALLYSWKILTMECLKTVAVADEVGRLLCAKGCTFDAFNRSEQADLILDFCWEVVSVIDQHVWLYKKSLELLTFAIVQVLRKGKCRGCRMRRLALPFWTLLLRGHPFCVLVASLYVEKGNSSSRHLLYSSFCHCAQTACSNFHWFTGSRYTCKQTYQDGVKV